MTDLTPNHPAVEAAHTASQAWMDDVACKLPRDEMVYILSAALPHLTADDLRYTDAAEEIRTEGWLQGWAAGRDLDGDEDATPHLRDTPAGRALMAEAWTKFQEHYAAEWEEAYPEDVFPSPAPPPAVVSRESVAASMMRQWAKNLRSDRNPFEEDDQ